MTKTIKFLTCLLSVTVVSYSEIAVGDTFVIEAGYSNFIGMSGGATDAIEVLDSVVKNGDTTFYHFSVVSSKSDGFFEMGGSMKPLINSGEKTKLAILSSKPSSIQKNSPRFDGLQWILSEKSDLLFYKSIEPISPLSPIPIDTSIEPYTENDFYIVRYTDTSGMKWVKNENENRIFQAQVIFYEDSQDSAGIIQSDNPNISPTYYSTTGWIPANSLLHFRCFETSSIAYPLDGEQMTMKEGFYSTEIMHYKPIKPVSIIGNNTSIISSKITSSLKVTTYSIDGRVTNSRNFNQNGLCIIVQGNGYIKKNLSIRNK